MSADRWVEEIGLAAMLATKRLSGTTLVLKPREVQNSGISNPTKIVYVVQNIKNIYLTNAFSP